ncbi:MAG: adenosine kinase [Rikenellaceae bacterium]|nr:adenosine kinase [Rikenellaceae bacterium]
MKKVMGMGNALTDILVTIPNDALLDEFGLPRGSMNLVDATLQSRIAERTAECPMVLSLGGAAGNTIRAMAHLGAEVGFIGKVGADETGDFLEQTLRRLSIRPHIFRGSARSGRCVSLVSADGERTMATYLGAALELAPHELGETVFEDFDCLYIEGYLVQNHDLIRSAVQMAGRMGLKVAIDLASFNVVAENLDFLRGLVVDYVDIVFANEQEAEAFTGHSDPLRALEAIAALCEIAVVKVGARGAYVRNGGQAIHIGIPDGVRCIDSTGAGDFYAAGFLTGLCEGLTLRQCGTLGAVVAARVIGVVGTTIPEEVWHEIETDAAAVRAGKYLL